MFQVEITSRAKKDIESLDSGIAHRVLQKLTWLGENAHQISHDALQDLPEHLQGTYKYRVGDYRVLYKIDHIKRVIIITGVIPRKEKYRRLRR